MSGTAIPCKVLDLTPVELSGERFVVDLPKKTRSNLSLEVFGGATGEDRGAVVAKVELTSVPEEEKDGGEPLPLYVGTVGYDVKIDRAFEEDLSGVVVDVIWPFMRSVLADHARRLGVLAIGLPEALDAKAQYESEASGVEAPQSDAE